MNRGERSYLDLMRKIWSEGEVRTDRTGVGTRSLFGEQIEFPLDEGFPLLTTKRVFFKGIVHELLWFLTGSTNNNDLRARGVTIWDEWTLDESGELGPVYGKQWRAWEGADGQTYDQIAKVVRDIRERPDSRRLIVSAWNVADVEKVKLPACHTLFQFYVSQAGTLSCKLYQRSADYFLGVPFNIASYALLTEMIAHVCGLKPGRLIVTFGDVHLYLNHEEQVREQLSREPYDLPWIELSPQVKEIDDFKFEDVKLHGYESHPPIKADVAV